MAATCFSNVSINMFLNTLINNFVVLPQNLHETHETLMLQHWNLRKPISMFLYFAHTYLDPEQTMPYSF